MFRQITEIVSEAVDLSSLSFETLLTIGVFVLIAAVTLWKRHRQVGHTWTRSLSAVVKIHDRELSCTHCGHNEFQKREGLMVTTWMALFNLSFWSRSVPCYICGACGFVHWFFRQGAHTHKQALQHRD